MSTTRGQPGHLNLAATGMAERDGKCTYTRDQDASSPFHCLDIWTTVYAVSSSRRGRDRGSL